MNQQAPAPSPPETAGQPCSEPEAVVVAEILERRTGDGLARQGRDRARHRDGAGTDRRRRARYRSRRACRWSARRRPPAPTRASPRAASPSSSRAARCGMPAPKCAGSFFSRRRNGWASISMRSTSRTAPFPVPAMSGPAIGNLPRKSRSIATPRPDVTPKIASRRALAGNSVQRIDIPDKVLGRPRFIHDQALPGMLHGRVLRPENARAKLIELKEDGARAVAGLVAIVRDGSFAGVVSETEHGAEAALNALRKGATWSDGEPLPDENDLASFLKAQPSESTVIDKKTAASARRGGADDPAAIYPPLYRARLDRAVLRHGAVGRRPRPCLDPQPGRLSPARRSGAGSQTAGREHHGRAYGRRRLLRA